MGQGCPWHIPLCGHPLLLLPCTLVSQGDPLREAAPGRSSRRTLLGWGCGGRGRLPGAGLWLGVFLPEGAQACNRAWKQLIGRHGWLAWMVGKSRGLGCKARGRIWRGRRRQHGQSSSPRGGNGQRTVLSPGRGRSRRWRWPCWGRGLWKGRRGWWCPPARGPL